MHEFTWSVVNVSNKCQVIQRLNFEYVYDDDDSISSFRLFRCLFLTFMRSEEYISVYHTYILDASGNKLVWTKYL